MKSDEIFDRGAARYDAWYDSEDGAALFSAEVAALRAVVQTISGPALEIGVGTGRFAEALAIEFGIDPAFEPLAIARTRGVQVAVADGVALPFPDATFATVAIIFSLCFIEDPERAMAEATRVLRPGGQLLLGMIPVEGPLGQHYKRLGAEGHRYYRTARFYGRDDLARLLDDHGLEVRHRASTLFGLTFTDPATRMVQPGDTLDAGFLAISAQISQ